MFAATDQIIAHGGPWDGPDFWPIFPILCSLIVVAAIAAAVVLWRRNSAASGRRAGEAKLAERFAAGEIDEDEYTDRLDTLRDR